VRCSQIERAYQLFEKLLELDSKDVKSLNSYANGLLQQGETKRAYELFEKLLKLDSKDVKSLNSYANALLQNGETDRACLLFEKSLQLDNKNIITLNNYANALLKKGEIKKVFSLMEQSLKLDDKHVITLNRYANTLLQQGEIEKACQLFDKSLQLDDKNIITLNSYANALLQKGEIERASQLLEHSLQLDDKNIITLNSYANALLQNGEIERACLLFEQSLQLDDKNVITLDYHSYVCLQYSKKLESQGKYQDALSQLLAIDLNSQKNYHANIIRLHLGRLYYRLHQHNLGKQYFEEAIAHSTEEEKDQSLLYAARSLLAVSPHSEEAVSLLQQIEQSSLRYEEAMKAIALNADPETAYGLFAESEESFGDAEMLYRSIYHKIGNEVAILKSIAQRLLRKIAGEHPIVAEIVQDLDDLQESVTRQRTIEKAKIAAIPRQDYPQLIEIVSQTAHNISDEVNNILAAIESKTRRALRKLKIEDPLQENFQKLLLQLELTQTALNDLKSINEGIAIRRHRFPVYKLFEKWQPENWSNTPRIQRARIQLKIENPDSEFDGDEEKIKSILNELVENSLKQNHKHPDLLIRIVSNDLLNPSDIAMPTIPGDRKYLYLQVIDNGQGVPDDKKEWIFQPLNTTSPEDKGSGLGLFIARKTLQKMRGYIREVEEFGKGARFQIYIPYLSSQEF
jgi:signal transduction histidine kinase/cytochrome c-type biogenesis protein CcmH/NrfG